MEIKTFQGDDFVNYETKYVYALFEYEPVIIFIYNYVPKIFSEVCPSYV